MKCATHLTERYSLESLSELYSISPVDKEEVNA